MQSVLVTTHRDIYAVNFYLRIGAAARAEIFITKEKNVTPKIYLDGEVLMADLGKSFIVFE